MKPKPTRVDWDLGCFFFTLRTIPEITVKNLFEFGDGLLNHSVDFLRAYAETQLNEATFNCRTSETRSTIKNAKRSEMYDFATDNS